MSRARKAPAEAAAEVFETVPESTEGTLSATSAGLRAARPEIVALEIEDVGPPPARLIKKSLEELLCELQPGSNQSRVILGTSERGLTRAANKAFLTIVHEPAGDGIRVWVTGTVARPEPALVVENDLSEAAD